LGVSKKSAFEKTELLSRISWKNTQPASQCLHHATLPHLEPCFRDLACLDLIDSHHIDFAEALRKVSSHEFLIDNQITDDHTLDERAVQVGLLEALDVPLANLRCAIGKQR
jgi:hypothetical protein